MTPVEFSAGMNQLAAVFNRELTPGLLEVYRAQFGDWSGEAWAHVVNRACGELKFWPKPVELKEMGAVSRGDAVERAWGVVEGALRTVGRYRSVDFGPAVNAAVRHIGGWQKLCETNTDELHFRQRDFGKALDLYSRGGVTPEIGVHHAGLIEQDHVRRGLPVPEMLGEGPRAVPLVADFADKIAGARRRMLDAPPPQALPAGAKGAA